ncbi:S41 family peptidase [Flavobacterium sp. MK4S-17]|uniref:S41 family peptidase n=1 Tax=Flavobacterium sp. MK4S-17 TaxID=2543737 RepID=UPI00135924DE|nr:S41 family peptidase [Flavobacterium sp. MK4S-17]
MKKLVFLLLAALPSFGQECNCEESFNWAKKTFEENDAGFRYAVDKKGEAAYNAHNRSFLEKVKTINTTAGCAEAIYDWMKFFRNGHISVNIIEDNTGQDAEPAQEIPGHADWEKYDITEQQLNKYLSKIKKTSVEGIWKTGPYTIGIVKNGNGYTGFIIEGGNSGWQKNQVKIQFNAVSDNKYAGTYYLKNYSEYKFESAKLIGFNTMQISAFTLTRVNPDKKDSKNTINYLELLNAQGPMVQQYSENTLVLRIPSFAYENKRSIDSVINANHDKIIKTRNLVIDIRNNGGGSDNSYAQIIPYLYTNPIRIIGLEMLSTPLNNQRMEEFLKYPDISSEKKKAIKENLKTLNDNLGKFVNLNDQKVYVQTLDTVYNYPKNVAILINRANGSTSEQFSLAAKQSTKTKLFGTTTMGVLDISNMHFVTSPCGKIEMGYCLSKSYRIPEMAIDDKGIQPDYYLDDTIPDEDWVEYAEQTFSAK